LIRREQQSSGHFRLCTFPSPLFQRTTMVRFTKGMWTLWEDTVINWATEAVKTEAKPDSIRAVAVCLAVCLTYSTPYHRRGFRQRDTSTIAEIFSTHRQLHSNARLRCLTRYYSRATTGKAKRAATQDQISISSLTPTSSRKPCVRPASSPTHFNRPP
jgi:hypothetical protein